MRKHIDYSINRATKSVADTEDDTMNPITGEVFIKGNLATFKYHDKLRTGKVEKVGVDHVTLEHDEEHPIHKTKFQTYKFSKIQAV